METVTVVVPVDNVAGKVARRIEKTVQVAACVGGSRVGILFLNGGTQDRDAFASRAGGV